MIWVRDRHEGWVGGVSERVSATWASAFWESARVGCDDDGGTVVDVF